MKLIFSYLLVICSRIGFTQNSPTAVFVSGKEGYQTYRIPAIIKSPSGKLLAFAEGRKKSSGDFGDIDIVFKCSKDDGSTWNILKIVVNNDSLQAGNPAPVVDLTDPAYPKGRIFLFYNTGNNHEGEVRKGKGLREVWYITSVDDGNTWSQPVNITLQVHRPFQPNTNPQYTFTEDWRSYANTPGHAIQIQAGKYKGRIYVAANHSAGNPQQRFEDYHAHGFYTDNHGKNFYLSNNVSLKGSNESMVVEASNDRLIMNCRNQQGDVRARIIATSSNGGIVWDTAYIDKRLVDPVCQGSLLLIGKKKNKSIIAFCNAADKKKRDNLTLQISYNEGKTWPEHFLIAKNPECCSDDAGDYVAYSDLVLINRKTVGIFFEKDNYKKIVFTKVKIR